MQNQKLRRTEISKFDNYSDNIHLVKSNLEGFPCLKAGHNP